MDDDITNDFNLSLDIDIKFKRVSEIRSTTVVLSNDTHAVKVSLSKEDIREKYPWDYNILTGYRVINERNSN